MIYYINHFHITAICNYNWVIDQIRVLYQQIQEGNREKTDQAVELLNSIDNIDFLKQLAGNLFLKMASDFQTFSTVDLAQWLTKMEKEEDLDPLRTMISDKFRDLVSLKEGEETVSPMVSQIYVYVEAAQRMGKDVKPIDKDAMIEYVRKSGGVVIAKKGATFYAVSRSVCQLCKTLMASSESVVAVSSMMHGEYGIEDVC